MDIKHLSGNWLEVSYHWSLSIHRKNMLVDPIGMKRINNQYSSDIETSQHICFENSLTGFFIETLVGTELKLFTEDESST